MTSDTGEPRRDEGGARPSFRRITLTALRVPATVAVLVTAYYLLPLDHASTTTTLPILLIGLAVFVILTAGQVRMILRSPYPGLRAAEALATCVPFFLLLFAAAYVALASLSPGSFGEHLSHTDGLYFTVTVFSTVGFGDITAKSQTARLLVTVQMITNLIVLGLAVKAILAAVRRGQERKAATSD
ncbi:potassium channel family protein [Streptomyces sp. NPDC057253]|uniref:potassium channel family protein n=1 Tax=Streptomyces sp. NPDC057253 TaxID=3346069 RepID=UPI003629BF13